jgi:hypothetical protein
MIDWILSKNHKKTIDHSDHYSKGFDGRKVKIDDQIFYCGSCKDVWSNVAEFIDRAKWRKYPRGNIPSYGKKRKKCPNCEL